MCTLHPPSRPHFQPKPHLGTGITVSVSDPKALVDGELRVSPEYDACHS